MGIVRKILSDAFETCKQSLIMKKMDATDPTGMMIIRELGQVGTTWGFPLSPRLPVSASDFFGWNSDTMYGHGHAFKQSPCSMLYVLKR
jgi:hypothetical protein